MMKLLKIYLKKYHEANLWLIQSRVREHKKQASEGDTFTEMAMPLTYKANSHHPQVIFSRVDVGHNKAETSLIQQLYQDLENLPNISRLAGL